MARTYPVETDATIAISVRVEDWREYAPLPGFRYRAMLRCGCGGPEYECIEGYGDTPDDAVADLKRRLEE